MGGTFQCHDAVLNLSDPVDPKEPEWPKVDFIVGNPPFLGGKFLRRELGDAYVDQLFALWNSRVPAEADLCCYWFEKARAHIQRGRCWRAGLLATQGIRGGANREVLKKIQESGGIFWAISDKDWILEGANVHVSLIGFDDGTEKTRVLDGQPVPTINANLSATTDITQARILPANQDIAFMGDTKVGPFEIPESLAREWLPLRNPNGKSNAEVVRPWANGLEVMRTPQGLWIVDFPPGMSEAGAVQYEAPFEYIRKHVKPLRATNKRRVYVERWWIHAEARPEMRASMTGLPRFIATPRVSKHRIFAWIDVGVLPDCQLIVFARSDDYFFGILHSRPHEVWSLAQGTQLREKESGFRYTPTTCFETFPFPRPTAPQEQDIADAARVLDDARRNWLGDRSDKKRTLTALYNEKPTWLLDGHRRLDTAVFQAYGWDPGISDERLLDELLKLNLSRSTPLVPAAT
jgi:type II restriction/modification system DNA methylase subunit YeeA